jgi:hypothetical protein
MPGLVKSKIIGSGIIVMDGGNIVISDTDIENININGDKGKLIFFENTNFLTNSKIDLENISRVQLYNVSKENGTNNFENISGIFLSDSEISNIMINNSYETIILNTNIENYEQNFRTRAIAENSSINNMISKDFSYFYSINTNIDNLNNNNFSLFLNNKW